MQTNLMQGTKEWLDIRKKKITGTDSSVCLNLNPYQTQYDLWRRKLDLLPAIQENEAMRRGRELEPLALKEFESYTDIKMSPKVLINPNHNFMMASLDGINETHTRIVEIKCSAATYEMCKNKVIPSYYNCQIQHCLEVSGAEWAYYCCYWDGQISLMEIEKDEKFISKMIEAEKEFYRRLVEFDPPAPKHKHIESIEMLNAVNLYKNAYQKKKEAEEAMDIAKRKIEALAQGECIEGYDLKYTTYIEKGRIDYNAIPELKNIDLNKYRKEPITKTRITL